jgi:phospholipase/carboxylesterase
MALPFGHGHGKPRDRRVTSEHLGVRVICWDADDRGFSDGASYALSLGLANADLFTHVLAFSPGFVVPARPARTPSVYVSHGRADDVLPIARTTRRIVPRLRAAGIPVQVHEFDGGHTVPARIAEEAVRHFLG